MALLNRMLKNFPFEGRQMLMGGMMIFERGKSLWVFSSHYTFYYNDG